MSPGKIVVVAVSVLLGLLRVGGVANQAFQAAAHLWVGGLIVYTYMSRSSFSFNIVVALSVLELICFIISKVNSHGQRRRRA